MASRAECRSIRRSFKPKLTLQTLGRSLEVNIVPRGTEVALSRPPVLSIGPSLATHTLRVALS